MEGTSFKDPKELLGKLRSKKDWYEYLKYHSKFIFFYNQYRGVLFTIIQEHTDKIPEGLSLRQQASDQISRDDDFQCSQISRALNLQDHRLGQG
jgi:hypothetical protein